jgi:hypothetical protein
LKNKFQNDKKIQSTNLKSSLNAGFKSKDSPNLKSNVVKSDVLPSTFNLAKCILGAGVLALPSGNYAYSAV